MAGRRNPSYITPHVSQGQAALRYLDAAFTQARHDLGRHIPLRRLAIFLAIGEHPGIIQIEIEERVDANPTTVWTDILALSAVDRQGRPGCAVVRAREAVPVGKHLTYFLTPKGQDVYERISLLGDCEPQEG